MLDVHPPHGKLHGLRDFLLHLFTITCGLFIALLLEGMVERHHKNELRDVAKANLIQETQDNRAEVIRWEAAMKEEQSNLIGALNFIEAKKAGKPFSVDHITLGQTLPQLSDASWRTASATGALSLMDYKEAKKFASVYQLQDETERLEHETLDDLVQMQSYVIYGFDPEHFSPAEASSAEPLVRRGLAHLVATQQVAHGLLKSYDELLDPSHPLN